MLKNLIVLSFVLLSTTSVYAQSNESMLEEATTYYDNDQYREALNLLEKFVLTDSTQADAYRMLGYSYTQLNQVEKAKSAYRKAIQIDPEMSAAYYNLGGILEEMDSLAAAESCFRQYIALKETDADGYVRLGINLSLQGVPDSAMLLYEKAYALDSTDMMAIVLMAQENFSQGNFERASSFLVEAKNIDSLDVNLYYLHCQSAMNQGDYLTAIQQADQILSRDSLNFDAIMLKLEAEVLSITDTLYVYKDSLYNVKFRGINSLGFTHVLEPDLVDYNDYLDAIRRGEVLSLLGYFRFYALQSQQEDYSPYYQKSDPKIDEYWNAGNYEELSKYADDLLEMNPLLLDDLSKVAIANYQMRKMKEFHRLNAVYFGIIESILATGNGRNYDSAYVVMSPNDEYDILNYIGRQSRGQALHKSDGHSYDILDTINENEEEKDIYFNIDMPFGSLSTLLSDDQKEKKQKRKKKKKSGG